MSRFDDDDFDSDTDNTPVRSGQLSANGQWLFGTLFAVLTLIGFAFGVWAGAQRPKPIEIVKENTEPQPAPQPEPKEPEAKPKEPETKPSVNPESKPKEPEVKPKPMEKEPEPKPKPKEPEPKKPEPKPTPPVKKPEPKKPEVKAVAFAEVKPVLMKHCGNCHGLSAGKPKAGIDLRTVAAIMKGGNDGEIVKPGDPKNSRLYLSVMEGSMPPDGKPAPEPKELQLIHDWILSGAKERRRPIRAKTRRRVK